MDKDVLRDLLLETKAWQRGHFLLSSGRHSDQYIQCARLFENPLYGDLIGRALAEEFRGSEIDLVAGPALGGILLAYDVGRNLGKRVMFAERSEGKMTFRRGFHVELGERVLLVEDVVTTGGSLKEVADLVTQAGAEIVGMGTVIIRRSQGVEVRVPVTSLLELEIPSFSPEECPLCKQGRPFDKPGSRK